MEDPDEVEIEKDALPIGLITFALLGSSE